LAHLIKRLHLPLQEQAPAAVVTVSKTAETAVLAAVAVALAEVTRARLSQSLLDMAVVVAEEVAQVALVTGAAVAAVETAITAATPVEV
jgi:hypothetical protein